MVEIISKTLVAALLFICALQDIKEKRIRTWIVVLAAILLGICVPFLNTISLQDRLGGFLMGGSVILLSRLTQGKIGMGDGMILCVTGLGIGLWPNIELFAIALFYAAIVSIILLVSKKVSKKHSIPFVPFLLLSYLSILVAK